MGCIRGIHGHAEEGEAGAAEVRVRGAGVRGYEAEREGLATLRRSVSARIQA